MYEDYMIHLQKVKKNFLIALITITLTMGIMASISIRNTKIDAQGPKDLTTLDILQSNGSFVKMDFDIMYHHYGEYVYQNESDEHLFTKARLYFYPMGEKLLIVEPPERFFRDFEELVRLSNVGEVPVDSPLEISGRMIPVKSEVEKFTKEVLAEEFGMEEIDKELFNEYIWPYMLDVDIPKEIGQDNTGLLITFYGGIYIFFTLLMGMIFFIRIRRLKREYRDTEELIS